MRIMSTLLIIFTLIVSLLPLYIPYLYYVTKPSYSLTCMFRILKLIRFTFSDNLSPAQSLSLLYFISITCLLNEIKHNTPPHRVTQSGPRPILNYTLKTLIIALIIKLLGYRQFMNSYLIFALCGCLLYLTLEVILDICALLVQTMGLDTKPLFNDPGQATSLQNFWGNRCHLGIPSVLRRLLYTPIRRICTRYWPLRMDTVTTFLVSGLMHELIYVYLSRARPTWEMTWFFVLQGICIDLENLVKEMVGDRWKLHPAIARILTVGFVAATSYWLIYIQIVWYGMCMRMVWEFLVLSRYTDAASLWVLI